LAIKKAKTNPNRPVFSSNEELPKRITEQPSKTIIGKPTSDDEYENDNESSSSDDESKISKDSSSSDEESKKSEHYAVESISLRNILDPDYRSV
jgi:hypothetical protein